MVALSTRAKKIAGDYVKSLPTWIKVERAFLFGSAARGNMSRHSDIDLIIISNQFKKMNLIERLKFLSHLRSDKFIHVPMDILGYTKTEFDKLTKVSDMFAEAKKEAVKIE